MFQEHIPIYTFPGECQAESAAPGEFGRGQDPPLDGGQGRGGAGGHGPQVADRRAEVQNGFTLLMQTYCLAELKLDWVGSIDNRHSTK